MCEEIILNYFRGKIRKKYDPYNNKYYYNALDLFTILTNKTNAKKEWINYKEKLYSEHSILPSNIVMVKVSDNKYTDMIDIYSLIRILLTYPSIKAEHFRLYFIINVRKRIKRYIKPSKIIKDAIKMYENNTLTLNYISMSINDISKTLIIYLNSNV